MYGVRKWYVSEVKDVPEWKLIFLEEPFKLRIRGNLKDHFVEEFK